MATISYPIFNITVPTSDPGNGTTPPTPTACKILSLNNFLYIPALVVLFILAFLEKRRYRPDVCHGRPGLIVPLFFLDAHESRVSVAAAFGAITNIIVQLFKEDKLFCFEAPLWAKALMFQLRAFGAFLLCMPFVACLASRHRLVGALCCVAYTAASAVVLTMHLVTKYSDLIQDSVVTDALTNLPIYLCYFFLLLRSVHSVIVCLRTKKYIRTTNTRLVYAHQTAHVKKLLAGHVVTGSEGTESCTSKHIYKWHSDFKFPVRIIATIAVFGNMIYWFSIAVITQGPNLFKLKFQLEPYVNQTIIVGGVTVISPRCIDAFVVVWFLAAIISSLLAILHVLLFLRNYKKHILMLQRGDRSSMPAEEITPQNAMAYSMRFSGYSIAFMLWGQAISFLCILFGASVIGYILYFLTENGLLVTGILYLLQVLSVPVTFFIIFYLQIVLAKYALLQRKLRETDKNPPLNVDNRRVAEVVNYYALFANMTIGLGACIKRILFGAAVGIFTVGRVDLCQLRRGLETKDGGYMAYIGLLYLDHAHNNPIVRVFCKLLLKHRKKGDQEMTPISSRQNSLESIIPSNSCSSAASIEDGLQSRTNLPSRVCSSEVCRRARIRWHVALTMIRNPDILASRKWHLLALAREELKEEEKEENERDISTA